MLTDIDPKKFRSIRKSVEDVEEIIDDASLSALIILRIILATGIGYLYFKRGDELSKTDAKLLVILSKQVIGRKIAMKISFLKDPEPFSEVMKRDYLEEYEKEKTIK